MSKWSLGYLVFITKIIIQFKYNHKKLKDKEHSKVSESKK